MAQLLGNRFCIDSLRNDVTDVQGTIIDIFSRVGPVHHPSWKYPDRTSSEIDMTNLLETYDYSEDEEERQVAHIVLLEMVVDRLVLLLQAMSRYMDQICNMGKGAGSPQKSSNTSVGLVAKKYWNKTIQVYTLVHQLQSESKTKTRHITDLENTVAKLTEEFEALSSENSQLNNMAATFPVPLNHADSVLSGTVSRTSSYHISRDEINKSSQTLETAFVPCEACHFVQRSFREVGDNLVNLCQTQGLPSSLAKYQADVPELDWMSANDVARWAAEQSKDLSRVNKHMENLMNTINPLKTNLAKEQQDMAELKEKMAEVNKEIWLERETQAAQRKQFDNKIKQVQKEGNEMVHNVTREKDELTKHKEEVENQLETMKVQVEEQESLIHQLEEAKTKLVEDMNYQLENNEKARKLEIELESMRGRLAIVSQQLEENNKELTREKAKNKSVGKHVESVQGKQDSLVERLDELDQECEALRDQVAELEDEKESLEGAIEKGEEERREIKRKLKQQEDLVAEIQREKKTLSVGMEKARQDVQDMKRKIAEMTEKEKLIVEYPDLNGPVNPDYVGTGDIAKDMENQVKANSIRIQILEEQNTKLRQTITKMLTAQSKMSQADETPMPLWRPNDSMNINNSNIRSDGEENQIDNYSKSPIFKGQCFTEKQNNELPPRQIRKTTISPSGKGQEFTVGQSTKAAQKPRSRPGSATRGQAQSSSSSLNAYVQLKKTGMLQQKPQPPGQSRPSSGVRVPPSGRSENYQPKDVFMCGKCDKMYNNRQDLEIHKSYCFGGI